MYNFELEDYHTYYVSKTKVLVHNSDPCDNVPGKPKKFHGNDDRSEKVTKLYEKYDKDGNFEKNGITSQEPMERRYTSSEMDGGYLKEVDKGQRKEIRLKEREKTETNPGPKNKEPWAGKRKK